MYIYIYEVSLLWMSPSQPNDMNCLSWGSLTLAVWLRHVVQWQEEANLMVTSKPQICVIKPHGFIFCSCMCPFRGSGCSLSQGIISQFLSSGWNSTGRSLLKAERDLQEVRLSMGRRQRTKGKSLFLLVPDAVVFSWHISLVSLSHEGPY